MLPPRATTSELARLWNLTPARVGQFAKDGRIKKGTDGKFDVAQALAFRKQQISDDEVRTLFQSVGNRHGTQQPKIFDHIASLPREPTFEELLGIEPEPTFEELLGLDPLPIATPPSAAGEPTVVEQAFASQSALATLRAAEVQERIRRQKLRSDREEGLLISRADVRRRGQHAAKTIMTILNGLPAELANFVDRDARSLVRQAVQLRVDQAQHALFDAISAAADEDDDD